MNELLPAMLVGSGLAAIVCGLLLRGHARQARLEEVIDLPFGLRGIASESTSDARRVIAKIDRQRRLEALLVRAHLAIRPEQFALVVAVAGLATAALTTMLLRTWLAVPIGMALAPACAAAMLRRRAATRKRAIESQLPDALTVIASSLSSGHTFLRSLQLLCEELPPPLGEELARAVRDMQLGAPIIEALDALADRVDVADLRWVVQAIRIQQEVGGKLADLLHTLADFMRARDEVRREVKVLTAEGRLSMWVLGALPLFLLIVMRVLNPGYLAPLLHGWGLMALLICAGSVVTGVLLIRRMVSIEV